MGFCKRCGDIAPEARCRCGGTTVAPVFAWNHEKKKATESQDSWSKTYVSVNKPTSSALPPSTPISTIPADTATKRFPRPKSTSAMASGTLSRGVSEHILATTSQAPQLPSHLKFSTILSDPASDILPSFSAHEPTLSKVYGSVLQPKENLPLHSCAICSAVFPPDSTLYPNPSDPSDKEFICRQCFTVNGGSKGNCPSCSRPVLTLKAEGGFIQSGGKYWHKGCFSCLSCFKYTGNTPMVDLFGRPSCADCFDNCLKRDHPATPKKNRSSATNSPNVSARLSSSYRGKSREGSPVIGELEQRLGIVRSREGTPVVAEAGHYTNSSPALSLSALGKSQKVHRHTNQDNAYAKPLESPSSSSRHTHASASDTRQPQSGHNTSALDLTDLSMALFSESSPKQSSSTSNAQGALSDATPSTKMQALCNKCEQPAMSTRQGGQFVTIPGTDENDTPKLYHKDCFKCSVCEMPINDSKQGQASFVLASIGPCHVQCSRTEQHVVRHPTLVTPLKISARDILDAPTMISPNMTHSNKSNMVMSSRFERPLSTIQPKAMPRFGGQSACPGCQKAVSPMERGVVPGPQGTRWHASCLVCGGKRVMTSARLLGREDKQKGQPGCGKRLDSAAKSDGEGGIWCRECLLLIGIGGSPQTSPTRTPFIPPIDTSVPRSMGTTIARQVTGMTSGESILSQLTGGGLSPTRSISPTKQLGMMKPGMRPRPKSVIGIRTTLKSIDEGRGMFLIKQLTGQPHS